mmetsp:Transcript_135919/g.434868  ORF Transcript_135919/g.434868 Transcript_135919/m.434868 type:complete len:288 (+) Transcript_135919:620-1483(+)
MHGLRRRHLCRRQHGARRAEVSSAAVNFRRGGRRGKCRSFGGGLRPWGGAVVKRPVLGHLLKHWVNLLLRLLLCRLLRRKQACGNTGHRIGFATSWVSDLEHVSVDVHVAALRGPTTEHRGNVIPGAGLSAVTLAVGFRHRRWRSPHRPGRADARYRGRPDSGPLPAAAERRRGRRLLVGGRRGRADGRGGGRRRARGGAAAAARGGRGVSGGHLSALRSLLPRYLLHQARSGSGWRPWRPCLGRGPSNLIRRPFALFSHLLGAAREHSCVVVADPCCTAVSRDRRS